MPANWSHVQYVSHLTHLAYDTVFILRGAHSSHKKNHREIDTFELSPSSQCANIAPQWAPLTNVRPYRPPRPTQRDAASLETGAAMIAEGRAATATIFLARRDAPTPGGDGATTRGYCAGLRGEDD